MLRLADRYITQFTEMPENFVLPREHVTLKPIIESFHDSLADFVAYVRAIRNNLDGVEKSQVHEFYRTVYTRYVQQTRRARIEKALKVIEKTLGRPLDAEEKQRVARKLEQHWQARREMLRRANKGTPHGAGLFETFWEQVEKEIDEGDLPMFKF
jgi:hypothetical protein